MKVSVFLGPSMARDEARAVLPEAVFHPPAQQGDLLASVNQDGANIIGLIDGTFHQNLSVWHNEVCYLLHRGIIIFGASSMGALRAVETEHFGMIGVGQIFRWYKDAFITGDDEVALLHGDDSTGYRNLSIPLVNIRASTELAVSSKQINPSVATRLIKIAKDLYYPDRQLLSLLKHCKEAHFSADEVDAVRNILTKEYVDLKNSDAREMLTAIRRLLDGIDLPPKPISFTFARSSVFESLYSLDQRVRTENGEITLQDIVEYFALNSTDFQEVRRASLNRSIVCVFANLIGVRVTQDDIQYERSVFMLERNIESSEDLTLWLQNNLFSEADLEEFLAQEASCRRLRSWIRTCSSLDRGAKSLADELRMRGIFPQWANAAAEEATIVNAYQSNPEYKNTAEEDPRLLAKRHAAHTNVQIRGNAIDWAEDAGFDSVSALIDALARSVIANDVRARIARQLETINLAESRVRGTGDFLRATESERMRTERFLKGLGIRKGLMVLDLGCGNGSITFSLAGLGAEVVGVDVSAVFVDAGNKRAKDLGLTNCTFQEGDVSGLQTLGDKTYDLVLSFFGAIFAPSPFDVAKEMVRVTRNGGRIIMENWIPNDSGFVAEVLNICSFYSPPLPEELASPMLWGIEANVIDLFGSADVSRDRISFEKDTCLFNFPGTPSELVNEFRKLYAPIRLAFKAAAEKGRQNDLQRELEVLFASRNNSLNNEYTSIPATFLRVSVML